MAGNGNKLNEVLIWKIDKVYVNLLDISLEELIE